MALYGMIFSAVAVVSAVSLIGIVLLRHLHARIVPRLVALSVGAFLGGVFIHLLPTLATAGGADFARVSYYILGGIVFFLVTEKVVHWHHHHASPQQCADCPAHIAPVGHMVLFADAFHNFLDGAAIAAAFLVDVRIGIMTTLLIILHEIPQEMGDFGVLLHAGFAPRQALVANALSAVAAFLGAAVAIVAAHFVAAAAVPMMALAAGGMLYIALADLVPTLHERKHGAMLLADGMLVATGITLMALLALGEYLLI